jgi:hypothetical protein
VEPFARLDDVGPRSECADDSVGSNGIGAPSESARAAASHGPCAISCPKHGVQRIWERENGEMRLLLRDSSLTSADSTSVSDACVTLVQALKDKMTSRATRTVLRLAPSGRQWIRVPLTSLNLSRHGRIPPPKSKFETLASETTPVPSIQAAPAPAAAGSADAGQGSRIGTPNAGAVPVPDAGSPALEQAASFRGIKVPRKPSPPAEGGELPSFRSSANAPSVS